MSIKDKYQQMYDQIEIKSQWKSAIYRTAKKIVANRDKYEEISKACGGNIPWQFIGILHNRESSCNFTRHLHEGSPLSGRTKLVPRGHPRKGKPPFTFLESAVDALRLKGLEKVTDWSEGNLADLGERFNGLGYRNKGIPSPYLWSGSQHYVRGKYIRDHVFSASAVDQQMGIMPLLKAINDVATKNTDVNVATKQSRRMTFTNRARNFFKYLIPTGLFSWATLEQVNNFLTSPQALILLGMGILLWVMFEYLTYTGEREVKEGRYTPSKGRK